MYMRAHAGAGCVVRSVLVNVGGCVKTADSSVGVVVCLVGVSAFCHVHVTVSWGQVTPWGRWLL